jgi:hypothetical protein
MSCLNLRFSRKSNKSRVLSWLTGTKYKKKTTVGERIDRIISQTYFLDANLKVSKNIAPDPQSIFSKKKRKKIIYLEKINQVQKHRDLAFLQKKET